MSVSFLTSVNSWQTPFTLFLCFTVWMRKPPPSPPPVMAGSGGRRIHFPQHQRIGQHSVSLFFGMVFGMKGGGFRTVILVPWRLAMSMRGDHVSLVCICFFTHKNFLLFLLLCSWVSVATALRSLRGDLIPIVEKVTQLMLLTHLGSQ